MNDRRLLASITIHFLPFASTLSNNSIALDILLQASFVEACLFIAASALGTFTRTIVPSILFINAEIKNFSFCSLPHDSGR